MSEEIKNDVQETEVVNVIQNPESIKDLPFSELADLLNKAGCDDMSQHPLKDIISNIIDTRYPHSDGWEDFKGGNNYTDSWTRNKEDKQVGIGCNKHLSGSDMVYDWSGWEKLTTTPGSKW